MKKLATLVFAMLLTGSLAFAQAGTTSSSQSSTTTQPETGKKAHKGSKKSHKGGKKGKKGAATATPTPAK